LQIISSPDGLFTNSVRHFIGFGTILIFRGQFRQIGREFKGTNSLKTILLTFSIFPVAGFVTKFITATEYRATLKYGDLSGQQIIGSANRGAWVGGEECVMIFSFNRLFNKIYATVYPIHLDPSFCKFMSLINCQYPCLHGCQLVTLNWYINIY